MQLQLHAPDQEHTQQQQRRRSQHRTRSKIDRSRSAQDRRDAKRNEGLKTTADFYSWIIQPATQEEINFRHGHWHPRRARVREALVRTGANTFQLNRFDECGSDCRVEHSRTLNKIRVRASYCKNRHCEPCARAKANLIARNLRNELDHAKKNEHRFITLTLRHSDAPLQDQVHRLYKCFRKLRSSKIWKKSQDGGAFMLEIKHNGRAWHPHLHIISAGRFLKKEDLSAAWLKATGDSMIIDIRAMDHAKDVVHYVCKYITKSTSPAVWLDQDLADQFVIATRHVRTCSTFGTWRRFKLLACPKLADDWQPIGKLSDIWNAARGGEEWACGLILQLNRKDQLIEIE